MLIRTLTLPCLFGAMLLASASHAALRPPQGYYAPVETRKSEPKACPSVPTPYTGTLQFTSKYKGSDKARATLNEKAEKAFRKQTAGITRLEKDFNKQVMHYLRDGQPEQLACAMDWLSSWAEADALLSTDYNHTGKSMRKWALGSMAGAYLQLKFSESQPLAAYPQQVQVIESWFAKLADQAVKDWSDLPLKKINNHSYWTAWSVMAAAVALDRRDLFDWSVEQFRVAANQVDEDGFLPNEIKREHRALAYHNYALPPLAMIASFAQANAVDLRPENQGALKRLAERVLDGVNDPDDFASKTGEKQDMEDLRKDNKYSWLAPYCTLYACSADIEELKQDMGPFKTFRLGGNVTRVFEPQKPGDS
ncbi:MAG: mannuronate-specific alginate lyase [Pseudomonas sp.]|nr:mannuronate-specific alginate lyase [Pseudomonas sp.]